MSAAMVTLIGCSDSTQPPMPPTVAASAPITATELDEPTVASPANVAVGAQPLLATDPAQLADDLVNDERTLREPSTPESVLETAAHRQQAAYRAIGRHPEWDAITRPRIPS